MYVTFEYVSLLLIIICPLIVRYVWCGNRLYEINNGKMFVWLYLHTLHNLQEKSLSLNDAHSHQTKFSFSTFSTHTQNNNIQTQ